jgi:hypothetical protein
MASSSVMNAYALMDQDPSILEIRLKPENGFQTILLRSDFDAIRISKTPLTPPPAPRVIPPCPPPLKLRRQGAIGPESPIEHDICTPPRHCCMSSTGTLIADTPVAQAQRPVVPKLNLPVKPEDDTDEEDYSDMPPLIPAREIIAEWPSTCGLGCADPRELFSRWDDDEYPEINRYIPSSLFAEPISTSHHMFFDDEGNQITQGEFHAEQQKEEPWSVNLPSLEGQLVARHPKVLLAFFEFVEANNEFAQGDEHIMFPAIDSELVEYIETHPFFNEPNYEKATLRMYLAKYGEAR